MNAEQAVMQVEKVRVEDGRSRPWRTGKDLLDATRPFAEEFRLRSWWNVVSTFLALGTALTMAAILPWWPLRIIASILGGLLFVRAFILFHDFLHGALLRRSRVAQALFYAYGLVALTPPENWRRSHNFHHANVGKPIVSDNDSFSLLTSDIGVFPLMTTDMWRRASTWQRLRYRVHRHPLTMLAAYVTVFLWSLCLAPLLQNPRKNWPSILALIVHGGVIAGVSWIAGFSAALFGFLLPFAIAAAAGAYLFFAQLILKACALCPLRSGRTIAEPWNLQVTCSSALFFAGSLGTLGIIMSIT